MRTASPLRRLVARFNLAAFSAYLIATSVMAALPQFVPLAHAAGGLAITKTANTSTPAPGANVTYTITATNNSTNTHADGVVITDTYPSQMTFVSAVKTGGTEGNAITCVNSNALHKITCTYDGPASNNLHKQGNTSIITVVLTADSTCGAVRQNTAQVTSTTSSLSPSTASVNASVTVTCPTTGTLHVIKNTVGGNGTFHFTGAGTFDITTSGNTGTHDITGLSAGSYTVNETADAAWDTVNGCIGVSVTAGNTTNCTITNTLKKGTIHVTKNTVGGDGTFHFTGAASFDITTSGNTGTHDVTGLDAGTYSVNETPDAAWTTVNGCQNVSVTSGNTTNCTITNTLKNGTLHVIKNTVGGDGTFNFTGAANFGITTVGNTGTHDVTGLAAGTYSANETVPAGWDKTGDTCQNVSVTSGNTSTCTVTNTKRGHIIVVKDAVPNDAQDFTFTNNFANGNPASFSLDDDADGTLSNSRDSEVLPGTYALSESAVSGWSQTSATCSDGSPIGAIVVSPGETVTCTFTNTKKGTIHVIKSTIGGDDEFSFTADGGIDPFNDHQRSRPRHLPLYGR